MRPRGESRSSPSSTYVGQVAWQKPQCVHLRSCASQALNAGAASCVEVNSVRMRLRCEVEAMRIENAARIKGALDALAQCAHSGAFGMQRPTVVTNLLTGS